MGIFNVSRPIEPKLEVMNSPFLASLPVSLEADANMTDRNMEFKINLMTMAFLLRCERSSHAV